MFYCASCSFSPFPGILIHASKISKHGVSSVCTLRVQYVSRLNAACPRATTDTEAHQPQSEPPFSIDTVYWQYSLANACPVSDPLTLATCRTDHRFSAAHRGACVTDRQG